MPVVIRKFVVTGSFVERVNSSMMSGSFEKFAVLHSSAIPARVREIISSTKLSEDDMRKQYSEAIQMVKTSA